MRHSISIFLLCFLFANNIYAQYSSVEPGSSISDAPIINCLLDSVDGYGFHTDFQFINNDVLPQCPDVTLQNTQWLAIMAEFSSIELEIEVNNCFGIPTVDAGLQVVAFEVGNTCDVQALTPIYCEPNLAAVPNNFNFTLTGLEFRRIYYIMIDGFDGDVCDYTIRKISTTPPMVPPFEEPYLAGPTSGFPGETLNYEWVIPDNPEYEPFNPCNNAVPDTCLGEATCPNPMFGIEWTGPPGSTVLVDPTNPYLAEIILGSIPGEVCIEINIGCSVDGGCVDVDIPCSISINASGIDATCEQNNGSISGSILGGFGPFEINWSGGSQQVSGSAFSIDGLGPGDYSFSIADIFGGCIEFDQVTIQNIDEEDDLAVTVSEICDPNSDTYMVNLEFSGDGPFFVGGSQVGNNHLIGPFQDNDGYSVSVQSGGPCPVSESISGNASCPCDPVDVDLGSFTTCDGECVDVQGQSFCTDGSFSIPSTDPCIGNFTFDISVIPTDVLSINNLTTDCDASGDNYTVSFEVSGDGPFFINNIPFNGGTYTSESFTSNTSYNFEITTDFSCPFTEIISGNHECPCVPINQNLGSFLVCPGDCQEVEGQLFCDEGQFSIPSPDPCINNFVFEIIWYNSTPISTGQEVSLCSPSGLNYTVSFEIMGTPPFNVNGVSVNSNNFTSAPISTGENYNFEISTVENCPQYAYVDGFHSCFDPNCLSEGGTISQDNITECISNSIETVVITPHTLDQNDIFEFILHNGSLTNPANIIARNQTGIFDFQNALMTTGQAYQISKVVGDNISGLVDLNSPCTVIKEGPTVTFYDVPEVMAMQDVSLTCLLPNATIEGSFEGNLGTPETQWNGPGITQTTPSLNIENEGLYTFTVTDLQTGCSAETSFMATEDKAGPIVSTQVEPLDCANTETTLYANSNDNVELFNWTAPNGQVYNQQNLTTSDPGNFQLIAVGENGCETTTSVSLEQMDDAPQIISSATISPSCYDEKDASISITEFEGEGDDFSFSLNGVNYSDINLFENLSAGNYAVGIIDSRGCESIKEIFVEPAQQLLVSLPDDIDIVLGEEVMLDFESNFEPQYIMWSNSQGEDFADVEELNLRPFNTMLYRITLMDEHDCSVSDEVVLNVKDNKDIAYVPNIFSPNNDGVNDVFSVFASPQVEEISSFQVFTRWGELVYQINNLPPQENPDFGWDGTRNGKPMSSATFVYKAEFKLINGEKEMIVGDVVLMK